MHTYKHIYIYTYTGCYVKAIFHPKMQIIELDVIPVILLFFQDFFFI